MSHSDLEDEIHQTMASIKISKTDAEKIALESDEMIDKVVDGVYISDAASVISDRGHERIQELDISHVLTTSGMPIPESSRLSNVHYKFIFMMDMLSQDLLGNNVLEDAITYIEKVRKSGGRILVHCEVGVSRSVAVVAAYLMKTHEWTPSKAILCIQKVRPIACPNNSFIRQLAIFHHLGYKADSETLSKSSYYRHFCADTGNIPHLDEPTASENHENNEKKLAIGPHTKAAMLSASTHRRYRCRRCRTDLFYDTHLMRHSLGGSMENDDTDHGDGLKDTNLCQFDYLVTPMKWMKCDEYQGKLNCPKCNEKLGQYIWGGRQCQGEDGKFCGRHVTPWFHIQKVKVDESVMSQLAARLAHLPTVVHPPNSAMTETVAENC